MTEWIVQINFKDQLKYENNKGFIKDIIKRKHGLSNFDALTQQWYNKSFPDIIVQRLVDGIKTVGLKVAGSKELADSLVIFVEDMSGVTITWLDNPVDNEVNEIVTLETSKFSSYMSNRVMSGEISKDVADVRVKMWASAVASYEYNKRGVEY